MLNEDPQLDAELAAESMRFYAALWALGYVAAWTDTRAILYRVADLSEAGRIGSSGDEGADLAELLKMAADL